MARVRVDPALNADASVGSFHQDAEVSVMYVDRTGTPSGSGVDLISHHSPRGTHVVWVKQGKTGGKLYGRLVAPRAASLRSGAGLAIDVFGVTLRPHVSKQPARDDARALKGDWQRIGSFLRRAIKKTIR